MPWADSARLSGNFNAGNWRFAFRVHQELSAWFLELPLLVEGPNRAGKKVCVSLFLISGNVQNMLLIFTKDGCALCPKEFLWQNIPQAGSGLVWEAFPFTSPKWMELESPPGCARGSCVVSGGAGPWVLTWVLMWVLSSPEQQQSTNLVRSQ